MPQVLAMVKEKFGSELVSLPDKPFDPDEAVAKGAALYGMNMAIIELVNQWQVNDNSDKDGGDGTSPNDVGHPDDKVLKDIANEMNLTLDVIQSAIDATTVNVASRSYGIRVKNADGQPVVFNLIHKQDKVPAEGSHVFPLSEGNANSLPLQVFENANLLDEASLDESEDVGETEMLLTPGLPKGAPFRITFKLDNGGILAFEAEDLTNNKNLKTTFTPKDALTPEQIAEKQKIIAELTTE